MCDRLVAASPQGLKTKPRVLLDKMREEGIEVDRYETELTTKVISSYKTGKKKKEEKKP